MFYNGCYKDERAAALASDTLARELIANGEQDFKLNFPDVDDEVHKRKPSSNYIGVHKSEKKWAVHRRSKNENSMIYNGSYEDEEKAAHASDTLARKLMGNSEQNHKLNFPNDNTEVYTAHASETLGRTLMKNMKQNDKIRSLSVKTEAHQQNNKRKRGSGKLNFWDILKTNDVSTLESFKNTQKVQDLLQNYHAVKSETEQNYVKTEE